MVVVKSLRFSEELVVFLDDFNERAILDKAFKERLTVEGRTVDVELIMLLHGRSVSLYFPS